MKHSAWLVVSAVGVVLLVPAACSVKTTAGPSGSGSGGTMTTTTGTGTGGKMTTSTTTTTTTSGSPTTGTTSGAGGNTSKFDAACDAPATSPSKGSCYKVPTPTCGAGGNGAGGAGSCSGLVNKGDPDCGKCNETSCCAQVKACSAIKNCISCVFDPNVDPNLCGDAALQKAADDLVNCATCNCAKVCGLQQCNPVTNEPCDTKSGESCDFDGNTGYICYPPPNDAKVCEACDNSNGPYCGPGLSCLQDGGCAHYCCNDGDCGTGTCDIAKGDTVGVCLHK